MLVWRRGPFTYLREKKVKGRRRQNRAYFVLVSEEAWYKCACADCAQGGGGGVPVSSFQPTLSGEYSFCILSLIELDWLDK